jgi:hypothetical protein
MLKLKKIRIITLVGIAFVLLIFVILPLIGHAYRTHHFNYLSVIPIKNWKRFSSDEGKFSVLFPGTPEATNDLIKTSFGEIRMQTFFVWSDIQTEYAVNYNDNPNIVEKLSPQQEFDSSQESVAEKFGEVINQRDFNFRDFPAREFDFVAGGKADFSGRVRLILVNQRLYQVIVIFLTKNPYLDDFKIFLDSFCIQKE